MLSIVATHMKLKLTLWGTEYVIFILVIISQCISSHHTVHFKYIELYYCHLFLNKVVKKKKSFTFF